MKDLRILKTTEISTLRNELLESQDHICPLCGCVIKDACLDHQHKLRKSDQPGEDGAGLVRGVLCRDCNALEGRIWNAMNRHIQPRNMIDRKAWLLNLIDYYNLEPLNIVYPGEMPKKVLSKKNFNIVNKLWKKDHPKSKPLEYPKSKHLTKKLETVFKHYNISPWN